MKNEPSTLLEIVGAGAIGSRLLPLVARISGLVKVTITDSDYYTAKNLASQAITPGDVDKPKAEAQAEKLRAIAPHLLVEARVERIENVPLGRLRADAILGCVDSREARRVIHEAAWRLDMPFIDAGVNADFQLVRVSAQMPSLEQPCMECAWSDNEYAQLEQAYACDGGPGRTHSTNAPAYLGALAAAMQAAELNRLLAGGRTALAAGTQTIFDASANGTVTRTIFRRNASCRFDHAVWKIAPLPVRIEESTVGDILAQIGDADAELRVTGQRFASRLLCATCGKIADALRLTGRLARTDSRCDHCGTPLCPSGFDTRDFLTSRNVAPAMLDSRLCDAGFESGDVLGIGGGESRRFVELQESTEGANHE